MAELVSYGMMSTTSNALAGNLVKAQCDFCGRKYGSLEEAKECEAKHINDELDKPLDELIRRGENNG